MVKLKYGNTNTFFINGKDGGLLIDTDYAGKMSAFYKTIKEVGIKLEDIKYVLATHYHPDHIGLIGELKEKGIKLLLIDKQIEYVHFSDKIFEKEKIPYKVIKEEDAIIISSDESREFLNSLGIDGKIVYTPSHSKDSISLILDDGACFVGDLDPYEYIENYADNINFKKDWELIMALKPKIIYYSHRPEKVY